MKKWIPLFLFLLFAHDISIDAFGADCQDKAGAAICHTCICQTHFAPDSTANIGQKVSASTEYTPLPTPVLSVKDFSKAFFRPPIVLA